MVAGRWKDLRRRRQLDNYQQHIIMRKRELTQTLKFFLVPELGARKLSSPYIFVAGVELMSLPYHFSPSTPERTPVIPSLPPGVYWRDIFPSLSCMCTRISDLQFSLVILNYKSLALAVRRLSALYISLFIQLPMSLSVTLHSEQYPKACKGD